MDTPPPRRRRWLAWSLVTLVVLAGILAALFHDDLIRTSLDPKRPFQISTPPPAPDYTTRAGWALLPTRPQAPTGDEPAIDVFFVSPTTYDGGEHWNGPIDDVDANLNFREVMAPNYAGPFVRVGRIFAPRYRQASLYSLLTLREDARDARRFAYGDVAAAFATYVSFYGGDRPFVLVGVGQGGTLAARLLGETIMSDPALRRRLVAAYLVDTVIPADGAGAPPCAEPRQTGCVAAWAETLEGEDEQARRLLSRALVWNARGDLQNLGGRPALCFNPILGAVTDAPGPTRLHRGAANATGLEWGARPAFLARQVSAQCVGGVLRVSRPKSASLRPSGSWADRRKQPGYNHFYADIEADALGRVRAFIAANPRP